MRMSDCQTASSFLSFTHFHLEQNAKAIGFGMGMVSLALRIRHRARHTKHQFHYPNIRFWSWSAVNDLAFTRLV